MALVLGSASHVMAGGRPPSTLTLLTLLTLVTVIASALMGSQVSRLRLVAMTVGGQVLLHHTLSIGSGSMHQSHIPAPLDLTTVSAGASAAVSAETLQMTFLHAVAALAVAWWLAQGERVLWTLTALLSSRWARMLTLLQVALAPLLIDKSNDHSLTVTAGPPPLKQQVWTFSTCDRGPPSGFPIRRLALV